MAAATISSTIMLHAFTVKERTEKAPIINKILRYHQKSRIKRYGSPFASRMVVYSLASQPLFLPALIVGGVVIETMRGRGKQERESGIT